MVLVSSMHRIGLFGVTSTESHHVMLCLYLYIAVIMLEAAC